jgi:hypothetical protein
LRELLCGLSQIGIDARLPSTAGLAIGRENVVIRDRES